MSLASTRLLKYAVPLINTYGFTREALARSVLSLPPGESTKEHSEPLSDPAVSALFGQGDDARRTLINAWLQEGLEHMRHVALRGRQSHLPQPPEPTGSRQGDSLPIPAARDLLVARLQYNEPVLARLPEAFALLGTHGFHVYDPLPGLKHVANIADRACLLSQDKSLQLEWYARRGSLAATYAAAELHQLTSPHSAISFLDNLLHSTTNIKSTLEDVGQYSSYIFKSWRGIIKSSGIF